MLWSASILLVLAVPASAPAELEATVEVGYLDRRVPALGAPPAYHVAPQGHAGLGLSLLAALPVPKAPRWSICAGAEYITSLGWRAAVTDAVSTPRDPRVRSQQALVAAGFQVHAKRIVAVGARVGYGFNAFGFESKIGVPSYLLHGPVAGPTVGLRWRDRLGLDAQVLGGIGFAASELDAFPPGIRAPLLQARVRASVRIAWRLHTFAAYGENHAWLSGRGTDATRSVLFGLGVRVSRGPRVDPTTSTRGE